MSPTVVGLASWIPPLAANVNVKWPCGRFLRKAGRNGTPY